MTKLLAVLVLAGALPLLWLAIQKPRSATDEPAWAQPGAFTKPPKNTVDMQDVILQMKAVPRLVRPALDKFGRVLGRITPTGIGNNLERGVLLCGLQGRVSVTTLLGVKFFTAAAGLASGAFIFLTWTGLKRWIVGALAVYVGWALVNILLNGRGERRQTEIRHKLPDVLDQMSVCVEAGLGFDAAMLRAAKSAGGPLGEELGRTIQDIRLGASRSGALGALVDRSSVTEVRLFARALIQAEKTGIPIAKVLRVQAEDARERRRQAAEERAMKLPVKMLFPLMACILPSLFIVILAPAIIRIAESGLGS